MTGKLIGIGDSKHHVELGLNSVTNSSVLSTNPSLMLVVPSLRFGNIFLLGELSKSSSSYK
jgi:hypothetical protein